MKTTLEHLLAGQSLTLEQAQRVGDMLAEGQIAPAAAGAFLGILRLKQESPEEVAGLAEAFRSRAVGLDQEFSGAVDCCGTGGDGYGTFNVSTCVALVLVAGGATVPKHGNRALSSQCGSADVLDELGLPIDLEPDQVVDSLQRHKFAFLMAPKFHPSFKHMGPIRKDLGVRTVFNILGPLLNPAKVKRQLIGVFDPSLLSLMAETTQILGSEEVMVVASDDGMDEISICAPTQVAHLKAGKIEKYQVVPEDFGFKRGLAGDLKGGDAKVNAQILMKIWAGEVSPRQSLVALNAGAGLLVAGLVKNMSEGVERALAILNSGQIVKQLENLKRH